MLTSDGPKVVEFNARFGDPETQALMLLVTSDMYQSMLACSPLSPTSLGDFPVEFAPGMSAAAVVQASEGYPGAYEGPTLFVNSDAFVNIVMPALTVQNNDSPPLFVNSDAFVNIARLHIHVPLERSWYGSCQHE
jgi:phosphoribosylamine-glycine ligase